MACRRHPFLYECYAKPPPSTSSSSSDVDHLDRPGSRVSRRGNSPQSHPAYHPLCHIVLTDFGPESLRVLLRKKAMAKRAESQSTDGRILESEKSKDQGVLDMARFPLKPRAGFQRSLKRRSRPSEKDLQKTKIESYTGEADDADIDEDAKHKPPKLRPRKSRLRLNDPSSNDVDDSPAINETPVGDTLWSPKQRQDKLVSAVTWSRRSVGSSKPLSSLPAANYPSSPLLTSQPFQRQVAPVDRNNIGVVEGVAENESQPDSPSQRRRKRLCQPAVIEPTALQQTKSSASPTPEPTAAARARSSLCYPLNKGLTLRSDESVDVTENNSNDRLIKSSLQNKREEMASEQFANVKAKSYRENDKALSDLRGTTEGGAPDENDVGRARMPPWRNNQEDRPRKLSDSGLAKMVRGSKSTTEDTHLLYSSGENHNGTAVSQSTADLPKCAPDPSNCPPPENQCRWPEGVPDDVLGLMCESLAQEDVHNLRRTCKRFAVMFEPMLFRNIVIKFGRHFLDLTKSASGQNGAETPTNTMLQRLGKNVNKFGIAFEVDLIGLYGAKPKVRQHQVGAWWGEHSWPVAQYPRFPQLQALEELADNHRPILCDAFKHLANSTELGLSVDSGHGWLNGADISDMSLFDARCDRGSKVFGKTFSAPNKWLEHMRNILFTVAQVNTITESVKALREVPNPSSDLSKVIEFLTTMEIRDRDSFRDPNQQDDYDSELHTGGLEIIAMPDPVAVPRLMPPNSVNTTQRLPGRGQARQASSRITSEITLPTFRPQWPIIFNGFNIAGEMGGTCGWIRSKFTQLRYFPLRPGDLTEAQAQWLLETVWAQRAFLSAYTTAAITSKAHLSQVHTLTIAKLSSGLLSSFAQHEFWAALPGLRKLTILVSPDWRTELTDGDREYGNNMLVAPVEAAVKFAAFLKTYIAPIERLWTLHIGFVGGGEHATGIYARNKNVLPAPITSDPRAWVSDHVVRPNLETMNKFEHIRDLKFENCWFSPCMLEAFMTRSRDSSLQRLTLESVSLTATHTNRLGGPLHAIGGHLAPRYDVRAWLYESLPGHGCWPAVLDRITPGITFHERRAALYQDSVMQINASSPPCQFRGHIEEIVLKSCGYCKISGVDSDELNQNDLVRHIYPAMDPGLLVRTGMIAGVGPDVGDSRSESVRHVYNGNAPQHAAGPAAAAVNAPIPISAVHTPWGQNLQELVGRDNREPSKYTMLSRKDPITGRERFGLGKLTQAVHPVEKRVLEQAWECTFGWGDDLRRFAAVEDGCYEGGTGRFSGVIRRGDEEEALADL